MTQVYKLVNMNVKEQFNLFLNLMKLSVKNLKGEVFTVEVEPVDTVLTLKNKIQEQKGLPADSLKIVYKGKTINNEDEIEKLGIKQTDFLVVMSQVAKPQPKAKEQIKPQNNEVKVETKQVKPEIKNEEKKQAKQSIPVQQNSSNEAEINELMSMGFSRQKCVEALRAAFNNTERAVQYLINGIPAHIKNNPPQQANLGGQGGETEALGVSQLQAIIRNPQFAQIRNLIRQNPAALQPILAQIAQTSPQLYNLIAQHPEQFERLITGDDGEGQEGEEGSLPPQHPPGSIIISAADEQAINRLRALGFSKIECAQAYFACDKNEQIAANLLFDRLANGDIEMEPQIPQQGSQNNSGNQGNQGQGGNNAKKQDQDDDNLFN